MNTARPRPAPPKLVIPDTSAQPETRSTYQIGLARGAIRVREQQRDECRRIAMEAARREDFGTAERFHREADEAEARIEVLSREAAVGL